MLREIRSWTVDLWHIWLLCSLFFVFLVMSGEARTEELQQTCSAITGESCDVLESPACHTCLRKLR